LQKRQDVASPAPLFRRDEDLKAILEVRLYIVWIENRLREVAQIFSVSVAGFSVLDNHSANGRETSKPAFRRIPGVGIVIGGVRDREWAVILRWA
jgi:hypothetical protein